MSTKNIFNSIGANYLRSLLGVLLLLLLFPILGNVYDDIFTSSPNLYLLSLFVIIANALGIYAGEAIDYIWYLFIKKWCFKTSTSKNFIGFPPWEAWKDDVLDSYRQSIQSRSYLIISIVLGIPILGYYLFYRDRSEFELDFENIGWGGFTLLVIAMLLFLLLPSISSIYLVKGRLIFWRKVEENKTYTASLFASIKATDEYARDDIRMFVIKQVLHNYLVNYTFYKDNRITTYLKMVAIMHTNVRTIPEIRELKIVFRHKRPRYSSGSQKDRRFEYLDENETIIDQRFWREFDSFDESTKLAFEELKKGNFNSAKLQLITSLRTFRVFLTNEIEAKGGEITEEDRKSLICELEDSVHISKDMQGHIGSEGKRPVRDFLNLTYNLILARSVHTQTKVLNMLTASTFKRIRVEVARNENSCDLTLSKLIEDHELDVRLAVYTNPSLPSEMLERLKDKIGILEAIAGNSSTPIKILTSMSKYDIPEVKFAIAENPATPYKLLKKMLEEQNLEIKYIVAESLNTPKNILKELADEQDTYLMEKIAGNTETPVDVLIKLTENTDSYVKQAVAGNLNTPKEILEEMAEHPDLYIQRVVAGNINTPKEALRKLAVKYECPEEIIEVIGRNTNTPQDVLEGLANHESIEIRKVIAKNNNTPKKILEKLAIDSKIYVRMKVAENTTTPVGILKEMMEREFEQIKAQIAKFGDSIDNVKEFLDKQRAHISTKLLIGSDTEVYKNLIKRVKEMFTSVIVEVAKNPNISENMMIELAEDKRRRIREGIAENVKASDEVFEILGEDDEIRVRVKVAGNLKASERILKKLANNKETKIREQVGKNPKTPSEILRQLANDRETGVREKVAGNLSVSPEILKQLAGDEELKIREKVAGNRNTPIEILETFI